MAHSLQALVSSLLFQKKFSDVNFVVGSQKEEIPAHAVILSPFSTILASLIYENNECKATSSSLAYKAVASKTSGGMEIVLPNTEPQLLKLFLELCYKSTLPITRTSLNSLLDFGTDFGAGEVLARCVQHLKQNEVQLDSVLSLLQGRFGSSSQFMPIFGTHAAAIIESDEWLSLPEATLVNFVQSSLLEARELDLLKACIKWAKAQLKKQNEKDSSENMRKVLAKIIPHIRFPLLTLSDLAGFVSQLNLIDSASMLSCFTYLSSGKAVNLPFCCDSRAVLPKEIEIKGDPIDKSNPMEDTLYISSDPLPGPLSKIVMSMKWKDQGWGNQKGQVWVKLVRGTQFICESRPFGIASHEWDEQTKVLIKSDPVVSQSKKGDHLEFWHIVGGGGGHHLYVEHFEARLS
eukprot:TRINITY_DN1661_c0_g1_i1.p1 TRINITY_DN1661_c0_g1~~TRINITY_DN1661_c0_g1_i1.p1  ORF type:complete len:405 (+),score=33.27 TRINITY_DN1661_c0_g1_i1:25-1239(+)